MRMIGVGATLLIGLTTAATVAAQGPSTTPETTGAWTVVDAPILAGLDALEQVVSAGSEVVAVGSRCDDDGDCERLVLATPDGTGWAMRGALPGDVDLVADLIAHGTDLYVVGDDLDAVAAIWRSTDAGRTWQRVGDHDAFTPAADGRPLRGAIAGPYDIATLALTDGPAGLVSGGWLNGEGLDRSAVWTSPDGTDWRRLRLPRAMDRTGGVVDIAGREDGYALATADGPWWSDDGRTWTRATTDGGPEVLITDVEATETGYIGLGVGPAIASVWVAGPDGADWRRSADDPALSGVWEAELRAIGPRVVAVGIRDGDERIPTAWLLEAGTWSAERIQTAPGADPVDVTAIGDDLVVVGSVRGADGTSAGAAWRRVGSTG